MRVAMLAAGFVLAFSGEASAQFGVRPGQSVASLGGKPSASGNRFAFKVNVPTPHREFESYTAIATPETGVCKVWGIGRDHADDSYGASVRDAYANIKSILTEKYGPVQEYDFIKTGALWNEPREWVMAIHKKERTLVGYWTAENGNQLPEGVTAISLEVTAYRSDTAYLDLTYEFANFQRCKTITQAVAGQGL